MVLAEAESKVERMRQRSRMCQLQDLQTAEIWSLKDKLESNRMPRLRAVDMGLITVAELTSRVGLLSF